MTKVNKNNPKTDVHPHIVEAFAVINEFLPTLYVPKVLEVLKGKNVTTTKGVIRNVRSGGPEKCKNLPVLNALLEVANENKKELEGLGALLNPEKSQDHAS